MTWRDCIHAPLDKFKKHCNQFNDGSTSNAKMEKRKRGKITGIPIGKGNFGCARKCKFYEKKVKK